MYADLIAQDLAAHQLTESPRHVEAYMRLAWGTLDGLSRQGFADEVLVAADCVAANVAEAELLAQSYGL